MSPVPQVLMVIDIHIPFHQNWTLHTLCTGISIPYCLRVMTSCSDLSACLGCLAKSTFVVVGLFFFMFYILSETLITVYNGFNCHDGLNDWEWDYVM
jgi:hypothetical protein